MRPGVLAVFGVVVLACGDAKKSTPAPVPERERQAPHRVLMTTPPAEYVAALRLGRARVKAGDAAAAIDAYEAAVKIVPEDARTLVELARLSLEAGDGAGARSFATAAAGTTVNPRLRAAAWDLLGQAEQVLGHDDAARAAYRRSLSLIPAAAVAARAGEVGDPLAPVPMRGPVDDLDAACALFPDVTVDAPCAVAATRTLDLDSPYLGVAAFRFAGQTAPGRAASDAPCNLGVRTKAGWYVAVGIVECNPIGDGSAELETLSGISQRDRPPVVRLGYVVSHETRSVEDILRVVVLCGIGPSGVPSCVPGLPIYWSYTTWDPLEERSGAETDEASARYGLDMGGTLTLSGDTGHKISTSLEFR